MPTTASANRLPSVYALDDTWIKRWTLLPSEFAKGSAEGRGVRKRRAPQGAAKALGDHGSESALRAAFGLLLAAERRLP